VELYIRPSVPVIGRTFYIISYRPLMNVLVILLNCPELRLDIFLLRYEVHPIFVCCLIIRLFYVLCMYGAGIAQSV
jgi:hypothetical protein